MRFFSKKIILCKKIRLIFNIDSTTSGLHWRYCYHSALGVFQCESNLLKLVNLSIFIETTDYRSNFANTILFENNFQYLHRIFQDMSVSNFDSRRSLSSANRRWSTSPIVFVSFTQPCNQQDMKIRTIRKSAARWHGRRAWGYRKSILRANLNDDGFYYLGQ